MAKKKKKTQKKEAEKFVAPVGHRPAPVLQPQDEELFRAFQSNLLSLISHELRTPLTGILNSLSVLSEHDFGSTEKSQDSSLPIDELFKMAYQNSKKLNSSLSQLLDLAAIESGSFCLNMREVQPKWVLEKVLESMNFLLQQRDQKLQIETLPGRPDQEIVFLSDPQRLKRACEWVMEYLSPRAKPSSKWIATITPNAIEFSAELENDDTGPELDEEWTRAEVGFRAGVASPSSAFSGTVRSESEFLSRSREGLGSELMLTHEVMRLHGGDFQFQREGSQVRYLMSFPEISSSESLKQILSSRIYATTAGLGNVALVLVKAEPGESLDTLRSQLKKTLFRASDAVYDYDNQGVLALLMDDCSEKDLPQVIQRLESTIGRPLSQGLVLCPRDGTDAETLIRLALSGLNP